MKILGVLLLLAGLVVPDDKAEVVADFRRFYAKAKTAKERFEAVQVLKEIDTLDAAQALVTAFEDPDFEVRRAAIDVVSGFKKEDTAHWLVDEVLPGKKSYKKVHTRAGGAEAVGSMGYPFAYVTLSALLEEKEQELRLAAITGLGRLKDPRACTDLAGVVINGADPSLALGALDALVLIGSEQGAEPAVLAAVGSPDWKVRARAIKAVGELHMKAGIRPLIGRLDAEEGRLAGDAYQTLKKLTMKDFGDTSEYWLTWWNVAEAKWTVPDYAKVAADRAAEEARNKTSYVAPSKKEKAFMGVATRSENILFVIDVSGSMEVPFADPDRLKATGRTYSSY
ncbi:MAG TPA: HEAT repeat domain-containing protein, partial [Planctomycetota bacterium]|nr:HEAT repeat domain-containing protein [Planctomycetota bacterium]